MVESKDHTSSKMDDIDDDDCDDIDDGEHENVGSLTNKLNELKVNTIQ